ncbi:hypothetical protein K439DRAFT_1615729 [Ramaria rubella]|nr:hypothetical protein K439DRAFT_1615729 [Ramaria rubella]
MPSHTYDERPSNDIGPGIPGFDKCRLLSRHAHRTNPHSPAASTGSFMPPPLSQAPPPYTPNRRGHGFNGGVRKTPPKALDPPRRKFGSMKKTVTILSLLQPPGRQHHQAQGR